MTTRQEDDLTVAEIVILLSQDPSFELSSSSLNARVRMKAARACHATMQRETTSDLHPKESHTRRRKSGLY
jgi:hypothetical protein